MINRSVDARPTFCLASSDVRASNIIQHTFHDYADNWYQWMRYLLLRKKNYTKISYFGSHFCETVSRSKISPFQLKLSLNKMSFRHAIAVSSNPFNFSHSLHQRVWCKECTLTTLSGLQLTTMASWSDIQSSLVLAEKEKFLTAILSHQMCPLKTTYWTNVAYLGISFLTRRYLIHWYQLYIFEIMPFWFFWATLYRTFQKMYTSYFWGLREWTAPQAYRCQTPELTGGAWSGPVYRSRPTAARHQQGARSKHARLCTSQARYGRGRSSIVGSPCGGRAALPTSIRILKQKMV